MFFSSPSHNNVRKVALASHFLIPTCASLLNRLHKILMIKIVTIFIFYLNVRCAFAPPIMLVAVSLVVNDVRSSSLLTKFFRYDWLGMPLPQTRTTYLSSPLSTQVMCVVQWSKVMAGYHRMILEALARILKTPVSSISRSLVASIQQLGGVFLLLKVRARLRRFLPPPEGRQRVVGQVLLKPKLAT